MIPRFIRWFIKETTWITCNYERNLNFLFTASKQCLKQSQNIPNPFYLLILIRSPNPALLLPLLHYKFSVTLIDLPATGTNKISTKRSQTMLPHANSSSQLVWGCPHTSSETARLPMPLQFNALLIVVDFSWKRKESVVGDPFTKLNLKI